MVIKSKISYMKLFKLFFIFVFFLFCKFGFAQPFQMPSEVKMGQLKNGFTYYFIPNGDPGKVKVLIVTKVGSYLERVDQHGYAHMVEHMLFKGSENYPGNSCMEEMELMGMRRGIDYNGYTGIVDTEYFLTIPKNDNDYFDRSLSLLKDWMFNLEMDKETLENEKKVIIEEINRAGGEPEGSPNLIGTSLEGHDALGTKESVRKATSQGLCRFYKDNYIPSNMALIVYGEIDQHWAEKRIRKLFSHESESEDHQFNQYIDINNSTIVSGNYSGKSEKDPATFVLLFKEKPTVVIDYPTFKENLIKKLMVQILDRRLTTLFGNSVQNTSVNVGSVIQGNSIYNFRLVLSKDSDYNSIFKVFCEALAQVQQHGFSVEEIEFVKAMHLQYLERRHPDNVIMLSKIKNHFISGDIPLTEDKNEEITLKVLEELTPDDFLEAFNHMISLNKTILYDSSSVACSKDFNKTKILGQLEHLDTIPTQSFVFKTRGNIVRKSPESLKFEITSAKIAPIKKERKLDDGLKVLSYPNGLKVVLYESKEDKAVVKMVSPKGLSCVPEEERASFEKSLRYFIKEYGKYSEKEARAIEKSSGLSKKVSIDDYSYELNIGGPSANLEQMFKLFNLLITEPDYPESDVIITGLEKFSKRKKDNDESSDVNVEAELNSELINRFIEYDRAIKYDISNAVIFVQGNLPENIEELVSQFIGSIPSNQSDSLISKACEPIIPDSVICNNLSWNRDLAKIVYYFKRVSEHSVTMHDELVLQGVKEYAHLKMVQVMREKYGLVYATGKNADVYNVPFDYEMLRLAFMTDTSNVNQAYEIMKNEVFRTLSIDKLADREVQKVKAMLRSLYVMSFYVENRISDHWLRGYLKYQKLYSPKELDDMIKSITKQELEGCMHRIINPDKYIITNYLPKSKER